VHSAQVATPSDADPGDEQPPPGRLAVDTLGVSDVVVAILEARKTKPWATAAHVYREQRDDVVYVSVTLLEDPSAAPSGRREVVAAFAASRLGQDLATAFGPKDVIILK
jgi:hypothetical protein